MKTCTTSARKACASSAVKPPFAKTLGAETSSFMSMYEVPGGQDATMAESVGAGPIGAAMTSVLLVSAKLAKKHDSSRRLAVQIFQQDCAENDAQGT